MQNRFSKGGHCTEFKWYLTVENFYKRDLDAAR